MASPQVGDRAEASSDWKETRTMREEKMKQEDAPNERILFTIVLEALVILALSYAALS